ncbi:hypothetical protein K490DRAFT_52884 [Saccharata proteae CBS 121410]|uniref:Uncharacterized protein n=1 Tax=Saccharata proteae CBS 121410 TaxID=1314787 RepID=A0A9P4I1C4_9PEZI|nr:hypothetical protein K490DRAFT_52884 [Saccharata proteae CBS 121410]
MAEPPGPALPRRSGIFGGTMARTATPAAPSSYIHTSFNLTSPGAALQRARSLFDDAMTSADNPTASHTRIPRGIDFANLPRVRSTAKAPTPFSFEGLPLELRQNILREAADECRLSTGALIKLKALANNCGGQSWRSQLRTLDFHKLDKRELCRFMQLLHISKTTADTMPWVLEHWIGAKTGDPELMDILQFEDFVTNAEDHRDVSSIRVNIFEPRLRCRVPQRLYDFAPQLSLSQQLAGMRMRCPTYCRGACQKLYIKSKQGYNVLENGAGDGVAEQALAQGFSKWWGNAMAKLPPWIRFLEINMDMPIADERSVADKLQLYAWHRTRKRCYIKVLARFADCHYWMVLRPGDPKRMTEREFYEVRYPKTPALAPAPDPPASNHTAPASNRYNLRSRRRDRSGNRI